MKFTLYLMTILAFFVVIFFCSCDGNKAPKDAEIINNISSTQFTGNATDENSAPQGRQTYGPADGKTKAEDNKTKASYVGHKFNELAGKAEAECDKPGANTITGDEARAFSSNKVVSQFKVNKDGNFTFDITLDVDEVKIRHDGKVNITVQANILNANGTDYKDGGIANIPFEFQKNQNGNLEVIIFGDTANPDQPQANGDYNRTLSGPNGGVQFNQAGNYLLEFSLRILATAPVQTGNDGTPYRAEVKNVKATITIR